MTTSGTECTITASERTFAHLWALSGARRLVGYEAMLLSVLARTDLPLYGQLTAVDLDDPHAVLDAVETIQDWRRPVATGAAQSPSGHVHRSRPTSALPTCPSWRHRHERRHRRRPVSP
jgi:hypothetical protein